MMFSVLERLVNHSTLMWLGLEVSVSYVMQTSGVAFFFCRPVYVSKLPSAARSRSAPRCPALGDASSFFSRRHYDPTMGPASAANKLPQQHLAAAARRTSSCAPAFVKLHPLSPFTHAERLDVMALRERDISLGVLW